MLTCPASYVLPIHPKPLNLGNRPQPTREGVSTTAPGQGKSHNRRPRRNARGLACYHDSAVNFWFDSYGRKKKWRDVAVSVHMRCWSLADSIFGPRIEDHLGLFLVVTLQVAARRGLLMWPEIEIGRQGEFTAYLSIYQEYSN